MRKFSDPQSSLFAKVKKTKQKQQNLFTRLTEKRGTQIINVKVKEFYCKPTSHGDKVRGNKENSLNKSVYGNSVIQVSWSNFLMSSSCQCSGTGKHNRDARLLTVRIEVFP